MERSKINSGVRNQGVFIATGRFAQQAILTALDMMKNEGNVDIALGKHFGIVNRDKLMIIIGRTIKVSGGMHGQQLTQV